VLCRVLFAHALVAQPRLSLGWMRPLAPPLGDPRLGMTGIFLSLSRVLPNVYPLPDPVAGYRDEELGFGRLVDYGVIGPRLTQLYQWSARELDAPALVDYEREGALTYAWPIEQRDVWRAPSSPVVRFVQRTLPPEREEHVMDDDATTKKRKRLRVVQRYLVNPPAKASSANNELSVNTVLLERSSGRWGPTMPLTSTSDESDRARARQASAPSGKRSSHR